MANAGAELRTSAIAHRARESRTENKTRGEVSPRRAADFEEDKEERESMIRSSAKNPSNRATRSQKASFDRTLTTFLSVEAEDMNPVHQAIPVWSNWIFTDAPLRVISYGQLAVRAQLFNNRGAPDRVEKEIS